MFNSFNSCCKAAVDKSFKPSSTRSLFIAEPALAKQSHPEKEKDVAAVVAEPSSAEGENQFKFLKNKTSHQNLYYRTSVYVVARRLGYLGFSATAIALSGRGEIAKANHVIKADIDKLQIKGSELRCCK